ncbi:MAG TPA: 30S ribosomal protein S12 methylthiotransferase RimO [Gemmatimonadaceae bacterium]|nr:30S ribosomal protein S12 methylthiotransferase RimO [Gemmatimonadaceae bacterium]
MKYSILTLGCDKNTVDSERYVAELVAHGAEPAASATEADVILVNTCGFIDAAKRESIDTLLQAAAHKETGSARLVAALGCMVERHRRELEAALPEVDLFLGTSDSDRLIPALEARGLLGGAPLLAHPGVRLYAGDLPHVRYLKISEGCDHGCAFCAIPLMRGRHRSFGLDELVREAQLLELQGAREVNLVAQDLAHYGRDARDGRGLPELLRALVAETGIPWFRLLYVYSAGLTPRLLEQIAREPRIVRYLDIPMQHASDPVLVRMRRPERRDRQRATLRHIREIIPGVAIRTTVIVGFPGETEDDLRVLLDFLEEVRFERVGVFTYSAQEGTRAFELPDDVPDEIKRDRLERVMEVQRLVTAERYGERVGRVVPALVDRPDDGSGLAQARTDAQADDIDGVTWVATDAPPGALIEVRLDDVVDDYDFAATFLREIDRPARADGGRVRVADGGRRQLPVASSAGAFGR